jgi:hypothetical protein
LRLTCAVCAREFFWNRDDKKYCGVPCRQEADRARTRAAHAARREQHQVWMKAMGRG